MMRKPSSGGGGVSFVLVVSTVVCLVGFAGVSAVVVDVAAEDTGIDAGNTRSNATAIDTGNNTAAGTITIGDNDWYAIEFEKGERFAIRLDVREADGEDGNDGEDGDGGDEKKEDDEADNEDENEKEGKEDEIIRIRLYGPDGEPVTATENGSGGRASLSGVIEQSGTYYVKVDTVKEGKDSEETFLPSSYALTVTSRSPDERVPNEKNPPNENSTRVVPIESGETVTGVFTKEKSEYFSIDVDAGEVISIETTFEASPESAGTVFVYGPDGEQIHRSTTGDIHRIATEKDGTYTIKLVSKTGSDNHKYTLTATLSSNRSNKSNDVRHIATGDVVENSIASANETDRYAVDLKKGQGFTVLLKHINRKNPSTELSFEVYGPNGNRIGELPFNRPRRAYQTSPAAASAYGGDVVERSGTYYITVEGTPGADYSLVVNTVKLDKHDPNEQATSATAIDAGTTVSSVLTGYDRDVYSIKLRKNETVTIEHTGSGSGAFPLSLWVAGPSVTGQSSEDYSFGTYTITSSNGGTSGNLTFTANRTGIYYIKVVPDPERSTSSTFFEKVRYTITIRTSKAEMLTLNRPTTVAPSTATVTLNTSTTTITPTATSTPTPTATAIPTATSTPTPTTTTTPTPTATTTITKTTTNSSTDTPVTATATTAVMTTATDGPGFGVLVALFGFCGGAWWYRSRQ